MALFFIVIYIMKQHTEDFKIIAVKYYLNHSFEDTFAIFNCSKRSIIRWKKQYMITNNLQRKERIKGLYKINQEHINTILTQIKNYKTTTLRELKDTIEYKFNNINISKQHIRRILIANNISRKRVRHGHFPELRRGIETNQSLELSTFYNEINKYPINKIISIDETSLTPFMFRKYGYSSKGIRCIELTNNNKVFTKHTFIGAITNSKILAYKLYEKDSMNSDRLKDFLNDIISNYNLKNYLFILDNAKIHRTTDIQNIINKDNRVLYTVPYNPSTNPIENWFSQFKYWLSNSKMRTFKMLNDDIKDTIITKITPKNYSNYFDYAYDKTKFKKH